MNWKKTAKVGGISLVTAAALGYGLLFTKPGNSMMSFYVESLLNTDPKVPITVEKFSMTTNNVNLQLKVSDLIDTQLDGKFSLISGNFDGDYTMSIEDLSRINIAELKEVNAKGSFSTKGKIVSTDGGYTLNGDSTLYGGKLNYKMFLDDSELKNLYFKLDDVSLKTMLKQSGQIPVADADITITGNIKNAVEGKLDGKIVTKVSNGVVNKYIMKNYYGHDVKDDFTFSLNIDTLLDKTLAISSVNILNTYSSFNSPNFLIDLQSEEISGDYNLIVNDVSKFAKSQSHNLKGVISTTGKVSGKLSQAVIKGNSQLFDSKTDYTITMANDEVKSIDMDMLGISLKKMAQGNNQRVAMDGDLDVKIDIAEARLGKMDGVITTSLSNVRLDKESMNKHYEMDVSSNLNLQAKNHVKLVGNEAIINSNIKTDIASLDVNELVYNLKDNTSKGTYVLKSATMKDIIGLTTLAQKVPQKIANDTSSLVEIKGNIKGGNTPVIDGKTNFLDGELNFKYTNNLLNLNLVNSGITLKKDSQVVYDSNANANMKYNTKTQKVDLVFSLVQNDTKVDVKKAAFDLEKNRVYANVDFTSVDKQMNYLIQGNMDDPDITLKAQKPLLSKKYVDFMKREIDVNIDNEAQKKDVLKVINILSKPNATLTKADMLSIEAGVKGMVENLKNEYAKFKNVEFSKEHLENLEKISEKIRKEKRILTDEDMLEVEKRSKAIVKSLKEEWNGTYQKEQREKVLNYFISLGDKLKTKKLITKEEMDFEKRNLSNVLEQYQSVISNKNKVDHELKKYDSIVQVVKLLKKDEKFDREKFYKLIEDFNVMLDYVQHKIVSTDQTDSQLNIINEIADALREKSIAMKKL